MRTQPKTPEQAELFKEAQDLANKISKFVNCMSGGNERAKALGEAMASDHRTLQQVKMGVVLEFMTCLKEAHEAGFSDARNAAACKLSAKMLGACKEEDLYLPFI